MRQRFTLQEYLKPEYVTQVRAIREYVRRHPLLTEEEIKEGVRGTVNKKDFSTLFNLVETHWGIEWERENAKSPLRYHLRRK